MGEDNKVEESGIVSIPIGLLVLSSENPRIPGIDAADSGVIREMLDDQRKAGANRLVALASSIASYGFIGNEPLVVRPIEGGKYLVEEGNRRATAMMLSLDQSLLPEKYLDLAPKFARFSEKMSTVTPLCYVTEDIEKIDLIKRLRHNGPGQGEGLVPWNSTQRARFEEGSSGRENRLLSLRGQLEEYFEPGTPQRMSMASVPKTTFDRFFGSPEVRFSLGIKENGDRGYYYDGTMDSSIGYALGEIANNGERAINSKAQRLTLLNDSLNHQDEVEQIQGTLDGAGSFDTIVTDNGTDNGTDSSGTARSYPTGRSTVAPRSGCPLNTAGEPNIANIYRELKGIKADDYPMACGLLMRALIELSTDYYLMGKLEGEEYQKLSSGYASRIQRACKELVSDDTNMINNNDVDYMRKFAQNNDTVPVTLSSLSAIAHGTSGWPDGRSLILLWDKTYKVIRSMLGSCR